MRRVPRPGDRLGVLFGVQDGRRASIRPRFDNHGEPTWGSRASPRPRRFNSAAVRQPRRTCSRSWPRARTPGFNSAAVRQPRRTRPARLRPAWRPALQFGRGSTTTENDRGQDVRSGRPATSIRPRFDNHGELAWRTAASGPAPPLQFGRGSTTTENAGISTAAGFSSITVQLQFGRGSTTTENPHSCSSRFTSPAALQFGRGSTTTENSEGLTPIDEFMELQFGRGSTTTENPGVIEAHADHHLLQFGRGSTTTENGGVGAGGGRRVPDFNSAAVRQPRRTRPN